MPQTATSAPTEAALLTEAAAGSEPAFRTLVEPHRRALEIHCYRMLGSVHDAEEIVNDTFLRAWRHAGRFDGRAAVRTWLYRIATNACLDELRRRKRQPPAALQPYPDALADQAAEPIYDPAARYAQREGMELALLAAIQQLPGRQRAVLILRDVLGWTAPEVAQTLEMSTVAVNSALQRARATIDARRPAPTPSGAGPTERALLNRYIDAWQRDDVDALVALMCQEAEMVMPPGPDVIGAVDIAAFYRARIADGTLASIDLEPTRANGQPALIMRKRTDAGELLYGVLVFTVDEDVVISIEAFRDAEATPPFVDAHRALRGLPPASTRR